MMRQLANTAAVLLVLVVGKIAAEPATLALSPQHLGPFLSATNVEVGGKVTRVRLAPFKPTDGTLLQRVGTLGPGRGLILIFEGYQIQVHPGTTYQVFLDPPSNLTSTSAKSQNLGILQFRRESGGSTAVFGSFDVTSVVQALAKSKKLKNPTEIVLSPVGTAKQGAKVVITSIQVLEQPVSSH